MSKLPAIELGRFRGGDRDGKPFRVELELLMEQNLLLQANSGGGKSWALRRLIEQAYGKLPIIVIDPEGEFSTLRSKFDFLLVGKGGETPADPRSAKLLAHKLLELRVSAVCDLFELAPRTRVEWVAVFVQALVDAPKHLWGDLMLATDEAHDFAPEKGHGSSASNAPQAASTAALASFASKGRKRGFLTVAATQRLGKLSKDVAAELKNVLIGQTWIDIDRERAAEALGIGKANKAAFYDQIKAIEPGHFYALGRALALDPTRVVTGPVESEHPKRGHRPSAPPPPTSKIIHLLPQLGDLPKEAEEELTTERQLRAELARLRADLARAAKAPREAQPRVEQVTVERVPVAIRRGLAALGKQAAQVSRDLKRATAAADELAAAAEALIREAPSEAVIHRPNSVPQSAPGSTSRKPLPPRRAVLDGDGARSLSRSARAILVALVQFGGRATASQVAILSGYSIRSSGFVNALSELRSAGLMTGGRDALAVTDEGRALVGEVPPLPAGRALLDWWLASNKIGKCEKALLSVIYEHNTVDRETLANESGYSATSSGFVNALSTLRTLELASGPPGGGMKIADVFR